VIEIQHVTKRFYSVVAVNDVCLRIPAGEVVGILGPNGAGKTTLFKLIAGLLRPDAGHIRPLAGAWPAVGYKPDRLHFPNQMRVHQYLEMSAALDNIPRSEVRPRVRDKLHQLQLGEVAYQRIGDCSKGMRQRLAVAQATLGDAPLLLLDEPSNGLDPAGQSDICRLILDLRAAGRTVVISSHQLQEVTQVCTYLVILKQGEIIYQNAMMEALHERPHTTISAHADLQDMAGLLEALHPEIHVNGRTLILENEAIRLRRQVLSILIAAGFDIIHVDQQRVTLAEIYAEAVQ
jgi:ABC-2 type transport system ATP-binding protein